MLLHSFLNIQVKARTLAASPQPRTRAKGFNPSSFTFSPDINTRAAAPSDKGDELAAVTEPPSLNDDFNSRNFSLLSYGVVEKCQDEQISTWAVFNNRNGWTSPNTH